MSTTTITPTIQPPLPGANVRALAPTLNVAQARSELGCTEREVRALCEDRRFGITWSWDIAGRSAGFRELRMLRAAVEAFRDGRKCEISEHLVYAQLFVSRGNKPFVIAPQISRALTCTDSHTTQLVAEGSLPQMRGTNMRAGRDGAAVVAWNIMIAFLRERRMPRD